MSYFIKADPSFAKFFEEFEESFGSGCSYQVTEGGFIVYPKGDIKQDEVFRMALSIWLSREVFYDTMEEAHSIIDSANVNIIEVVREMAIDFKSSRYYPMMTHLLLLDALEEGETFNVESFKKFTLRDLREEINQRISAMGVKSRPSSIMGQEEYDSTIDSIASFAADCPHYDAEIKHLCIELCKSDSTLTALDENGRNRVEINEAYFEKLFDGTFLPEKATATEMEKNFSYLALSTRIFPVVAVTLRVGEGVSKEDEDLWVRLVKDIQSMHPFVFNMV